MNYTPELKEQVQGLIDAVGPSAAFSILHQVFEECSFSSKYEQKQVREKLSYWQNEYQQHLPPGADQEEHHRVLARGEQYIITTGKYPEHYLFE